MVRALTLITLIVGAGLMTGCGIKPGEVNAPEGENAPGFPRTYPDLSHDPQAKRP